MSEAVDDGDQRLAAVVPAYIREHDSPAALFTRLQRVVILLEHLQVEAVRRFDISFRDFVILATLRKEPAPNELLVTRLAEYVLRPMGSISQAIDRVERRGLVRRRTASTDRRKVIVTLTDTGRQFADETLAAYDEIRDRVFARLGAEDLEVVDGSVMLLLDALEADHWEHSGA